MFDPLHDEIEEMFAELATAQTRNYVSVNLCKRVVLPPESRAAAKRAASARWREKNLEHTKERGRRYAAAKRAAETPEEHTARLAKAKEYQATLSEAKRAARRAYNKAYMAAYRANDGTRKQGD